MCDADVDGSHISTLLLTFFFRQMPDLIRRGKVHLAQPPLYQITRNRKSQYVLNDAAMHDTLTQLGLDGSALLVRDPDALDPKTGEPKVVRRVEGDALLRLVRTLRRLAELVAVVERRGVPFTDLLASRSRDPKGQQRLPSHRLTWPGGEALAWSEEDARRILDEKGLRLADVSDDVSTIAQDGEGAPEPVAEPPASAAAGRAATLRELHENKELARIFSDLRGAGIEIDDFALTRVESVSGESRPTKYAWETSAKSAPAKKAEDSGDDSGDKAAEDEPHGTQQSVQRGKGKPAGRLVESANVPGILSALHEVGRRGMEIKRFKGLGEMNPEQLWETTMDPDRRTFLRISWDQAGEADALFTKLMGENVEARRKYIEEHALDVETLDV
jgi:DNA gyrase subunit B